jgi:hypothetical protein
LPDPLRFALWVGLAAMIVGLGCLGALAWHNTGSKNLMLATSTLAAAVILFVTQLPFELTTEPDTDFFSVEFTVDRVIPQIRQWSYPPVSPNNATWRLGRETSASNFLAENEPARFDGDRASLTLDMVLHSMVSHLGAQQFDWQQKRTVLQGPTVGVIWATERVSKTEECTVIFPQEIQAKLAAAGNAFAHAHLLVMTGQLCLPPKASLNITNSKLEISTPFCTISFTLVPSTAVINAKPESGGAVPTLKNGEPRYETRVTGIRVSVKYSRLRAQHKSMKKHKEWSNRLVESTRIWFEGERK